MRKYEFTNETLECNGIVLKRIIRTRDGMIGGFIQSELNLSHEGDAWVHGNALVSDNARVSGDARVYGNAWVSDNAQVFGDALVYGNAWVSDNAQVFGDARVFGDAQVFGDAWVSGNARVFGDALVSGDAWVHGNAWVEKPLDFIHVAGLRFPVTIRNDGFASIGCQTKAISEWLAMGFDSQKEIKNKEEFDGMCSVLRPIFEFFNQKDAK